MPNHTKGRAPRAGARCRFPCAIRNLDAQPCEGLGPRAGARRRLSPPPQVTGLLSHSRRGVRAPGATETPEPPRVPRGGLPSRPYAVSGRPEPRNHPGTEAREPAPRLWARPGQGPSPQKREETDTDPRARGFPCSTTRGAGPQGRCTVPGLPRSGLSLLFFSGRVRGSPHRPCVPFLGSGLSVAGVQPPLACGSAHAFSHSFGEGPSPGPGQGQSAGSRVPRA